MSFAKKFQCQLSILVMVLLLVSIKVAAQTTESPLNQSQPAVGIDNEVCLSSTLKCLQLGNTDPVLTQEPGTKANPAGSCHALLWKKKEKEKHAVMKSGYYWVKPAETSNAVYQVYCDMNETTFGGGWTLVVGINGLSREHLLSRSVGLKCRGEDLCVTHRSNGAIPARKLDDSDIRELANNTGTFRIDVGPGSFTTFFQLPEGPMNFHSNCEGSRCSRIITSHTYPYEWESNCKGIPTGYQIKDKHQVFDNQDNNECEEPWKSSLYDSRQVLYGKPDSTGIYRNQQGFMYVR